MPKRLSDCRPRLQCVLCGESDWADHFCRAGWSLDPPKHKKCLRKEIMRKAGLET